MAISPHLLSFSQPLDFATLSIYLLHNLLAFPKDDALDLNQKGIGINNQYLLTISTLLLN